MFETFWSQRGEVRTMKGKRRTFQKSIASGQVHDLGEATSWVIATVLKGLHKY
jgi:hypothetical protein